MASKPVTYIWNGKELVQKQSLKTLANRILEKHGYPTESRADYLKRRLDEIFPW